MSLARIRLRPVVLAQGGAGGHARRDAAVRLGERLRPIEPRAAVGGSVLISAAAGAPRGDSPRLLGGGTFAVAVMLTECAERLALLANDRR